MSHLPPQLLKLLKTTHPRSEGFSLVEVVLALGIVSFSLVGILSIFPVALDTAKDSKNETRVTLIAQTIFSDLQTSPPSAAEVVIDEISNETESTVTNSSLNNFSPVYVAYNSEGLAITNLTSAQFNTYTGSDAAFLASVTATNQTALPGLALVNVSIQAPPRAAANAGSARKKYSFSAYLPTQ